MRIVNPVCALCGKDIRTHDTFYQVENEYWCEECVEGMRRWTEDIEEEPDGLMHYNYGREAV